jgi:hypothetical protein
MRPITRVALYVFAGFVALLGITSMLVDEPRQKPSLDGDVRWPPPSPRQPTHLAVAGLSLYERAEVFRNEILVAGFPCDRRVIRAEEPDNDSSVGFWIVDCQDGHTYTIEVGPSGSTKVRAATRLRQTK